METGTDRTGIFERMPVRQAVRRQIAPAIASQMVVLIYNLADTYFVGRLGDPRQTAAITVAYSSFLMLTAISNLFGVGGASAIAQALGSREKERAGQISAVAFWWGLSVAILYSLLFGLLASPILTLCGATKDTYTIVYGYAKWVILFGGPATVMNTLLANLVRAEGSAAAASFGISFGGVLNVVLDPFFVLPAFGNLGAEGAGIATALSNLAAVVWFLVYIGRKRGKTVVCLHPSRLKHTREHLRPILSIGLSSALQYALTVVAVAAQARFVSGYPTEAVAALGIAKKLDQLPLYFSIGVSNGLLPLLAYNYASGDRKRRRDAFRYGVCISVGFALCSLAVYEILATRLAGLFIREEQTVRYAAAFLRCMVTAMPMMAFCYPMIIQFQAMGKVREALTCSILRKGVLDIPLLFLLDRLLPLYGCMWVQPIVDLVSLVVAVLFYRRLDREEKGLLQELR